MVTGRLCWLVLFQYIRLNWYTWSINNFTLSISATNSGCVDDILNLIGKWNSRCLGFDSSSYLVLLNKRYSLIPTFTNVPLYGIFSLYAISKPNSSLLAVLLMETITTGIFKPNVCRVSTMGCNYINRSKPVFNLSILNAHSFFCALKICSQPSIIKSS